MPWKPLPTGDGDAGSGPASIRSGLDRLVRRLGGPSVDAVDGVFGRWSEIVGDQVAAHTHPVSLRDGVLAVAVDDPAWATQLRFLEAEIVSRVGEVVEGGGVERIEVKVRPKRA